MSFPNFIFLDKSLKKEMLRFGSQVNCAYIEFSFDDTDRDVCQLYIVI